MPKMKKRSPEECWFMTGDFARIASVHGDLRVANPAAGFVTPQKFKRGKRLFGSALGPPDNQVVLDVYCTLPRAGGRECHSYEIRRTGPGSRLFDKKRVDVGNEHGLARQMARDAAKLWGCPPPRESGFDGPRRRRR